MLALSDNPPVLSPGLRSIADAVGRWWVAHTKSRCEKALAGDLLARGVAYFLPMTERVSVSGGRTRRGLAPLFPSYVFFCGDDERDNVSYRAAATGRLCRVIRVADQGRLIRELIDVERVLAARAALEPYPFAAAGRRCRVSAGPFRGLEGTIVRCDGAGSGGSRHCTRMVLEVGMLGRGVAMEIDAALLEPVDRAAPEPSLRGVALGAAG